MKKFIKNNVFGFVLGIVLCSGIVYGVNTYQSPTIEYSPTDASWEVSNVNEALNSLYELYNNPSNNELTYVGVLNTGYWNSSYSVDLSNSLISIGKDPSTLTINDFVISAKNVAYYCGGGYSFSASNSGSGGLPSFTYSNGVLNATNCFLTVGGGSKWFRIYMNYNVYLK